MENYKVKVNNWDESKEVQKLFITLGANCGIEEITSKWVCLYGSQITFYDLLPNVDFKQITLQYLRDLVVLKRNSIDDASFKDTFGDIWYVDSTNNYWMFENGTWREAEEPLFKLELIKKEGEVKMKEKEYIANVSGDWRLVDSHELVSGRIEVPEGAEEYRANYKFYKNNGGLYYSTYDEWVKSGIYPYKTLWNRGTTKRENKNREKLGSNKGEVMKEFLNPEQGYALVKCFVGETPIPESWIEVPEGAEIFLLDKSFYEDTLYFVKHDGKVFHEYYTNATDVSNNAWIKGTIKELHKGMGKVLWQRNTTTPNTEIQDKLKFIEKWLNGEKIQYILGIESEKTQADKSKWHNFTEGAMQYIKRPDIKFREAPKHVTINGIEFKSIEKLLKYVKNNFDLEDGE